MLTKKSTPRYKVPYKGEELEMEYKALNKLKESLTFLEVEKLIGACDTLKKKALIELAVSTGIRRDDIVSIEINRIDFDDNKIIFWEEKKDRLWVVAICPELAQTLKMYVRTLPKDQRFLFDFSGRTAYNILQKLLNKAMIKKHIPFHALRRTCIRLSKRMGRDIRFVMDQTGDTARVILEEYEGYTTDEMVEMLKEDNILKRARNLRGLDRTGCSDYWTRAEREMMEGKQFNLDHFGVFDYYRKAR